MFRLPPYFSSDVRRLYSCGHCFYTQQVPVVRFPSQFLAVSVWGRPPERRELQNCCFSFTFWADRRPPSIGMLFIMAYAKLLPPSFPPFFPPLRTIRIQGFLKPNSKSPKSCRSVYLMFNLFAYLMSSTPGDIPLCFGYCFPSPPLMRETSVRPTLSSDSVERQGFVQASPCDPKC